MWRRGADFVFLVIFLAILSLPSLSTAYEFDESFSAGGRIMTDAAWFTPGHDMGNGSESAFNSGVEFRRVRLFAEGTFDDRLAYKLQFDFAGGEPTLKDAYLSIVNLPVVGAIKAGHFKEPFSMEVLTSSKYIPLMERSLAPDTFAPSRNVGIQAGNALLDERLTWHLGAFRETNGFGEFLGDRGGALTGRVTGVPWRSGDNRIHAGLAYSRRTPPLEKTGGGTPRRLYDASVCSEAHLAPAALEIPGEGVSAESVDLMGAELASLVGPATFAAEYVGARLDPGDSGVDDSYLWGWYLTASILATGEHRPYDSDDGSFGRVHPSAPLTDGGPGAWEFVLRYSQIDLRDVSGGAIATITAGLNWYLHSRARIMVNYGFGNREFAGGEPGPVSHAFQMRAQVDF